MKLNSQICLTLFLCLICSPLQAIETPASIVYGQTYTSQIISVKPRVTLSSLKQGETISLQPNRFAFPGKIVSPIDYQQWLITDQWAIWRATFSADSAKSINLRLTTNKFPDEARVYFYQDSYSNSDNTFQEFFALSPNADGNLWTPVVEFDSSIESKTQLVTLEINIPLEKVDENNLKSVFDFEVSQVNLGYRLLDSQAKEEQNVLYEGCQLDTVCSEASIASDQVRSVARYTILGQYICTGTLINNSQYDRRPYFLTAKHCKLTPSSAKTTVFYWNYQASTCDGDRDGELTQITNGATLRAYSEDSDFALLELEKTPPVDFSLYWSGWNNDAIAPSTTYTIHHPRGREKAIGFNFLMPTITSQYNDSENSNGLFFRINGWDLGSTTDGSSGAGLWNDNGKLIGTLTGGFATCSQPALPDWFGRFHSHWQNHHWKYNQLAHWLAPKNASQTTVNGVNNCSVSEPNISISTSTPELGESVSFEANNLTDEYTIEWDFNDDGEFDSTGSSVEFRYQFIYQGYVRYKVTDSQGCSSSKVLSISVKNSGYESFPIDGRLSPFWEQTRTATKGWRLDSSRAFEGQYSLKSERIKQGETAGIEYIHNFSANENFIAFAISTTISEESRLKFYVDNKLVDQWQGNNNWQVNYYPLESGLHVLRWVYEKNQSDSTEDSVWIDAVSGLRKIEKESEEGGGSIPFIPIFLLPLISIAIILRTKKPRIERGFQNLNRY